MVLDMDLFRVDKGFDPEKVRDNQKRRFKDVGLVDIVVEKDKFWRQLRHRADNLNKLSNVCNKEIAKKMKKKEPIGDDESIPKEISGDLDNVVSDNLEALTVLQIRSIRALIVKEIDSNDKLLTSLEAERSTALKEVANLLHESVPVSNNEDENKVCRFLDMRILATVN